MNVDSFRLRRPVSRPAAFATRRQHDHTQPWAQYTPCACSSASRGAANTAVCGASCACARSENFCERWCACGPACANRHPGCVCDSNCGALCPCFLAGRECDPAKCHGCTSTALGLVRPGERVCLNLNITLGAARKLRMGESRIAGWGLFVADDIPKHGFLVCKPTLRYTCCTVGRDCLAVHMFHELCCIHVDGGVVRHECHNGI